MFVFKYTDDSDPQLRMESCHATEEEATAWHDATATNYPTWTVEAVREEPADYDPIQARCGTPVKESQGED